MPRTTKSTLSLKPLLQVNTHVKHHPGRLAHLCKHLHRIRRHTTPTRLANQVVHVLIPKAILGQVILAPRPREIFRERMDGLVAVAFTPGAGAFVDLPDAFAFGVFFVEGWRHFHGVPHGAAVAVEVIGGPDA